MVAEARALLSALLDHRLAIAVARMDERDLVAVAAARADGRHIASVVVTLPDNPTGTLASPGTVRDLCAVAAKHDLVIISDEIYRDLTYETVAPSPARF